MKKACLLLLILCPLALSAQFQSFPVSDNIPEEAVCYSLPATQFDIAVTVRTTVETPGEYARYAERYLGVKDVIMAESTKKEIVDIQIFPRTVADPLNRYYIIPSSMDSKVKPSMPLIGLTAEGILCSVNSDAAVCTANEATCPKTPQCCKKPDTGKTYPTLTSEMLQASSSMKMAELAAKQVFSLRDTRLALLQGELENAPKDGEALKLFLSELQNMEQSYTELFTGSRRESIETVHVAYLPQATGKGETAFRFSAQKGVVTSTDLSGSPVTLTVTPTEGTAIAQHINTYDNPDRKSDISSIEAPAGLYYYVPRQSLVEVSYNHKTFFQSAMCVAQGGVLMKLPASAQLQAVFSPVTGALINAVK